MDLEDNSTGSEELQGNNEVEIEIDCLSAIAPTMLEVEILPFPVADVSTQHQAGFKKLNDSKIPVPCYKGLSKPKDSSKMIQNPDILHPFRCHLCDYKCKKKQSLSLHFTARHNSRILYNCTLCDYSNAQSFLVRQHFKRFHTEENKPFMCNICDYGTVDRSNFKKHARIHSKEKIFKCKLCDYKCAESSNLKRHLLTHIKNKSYECNECDGQFNSPYLLKKHKQTDHKIE